MVAGFQDVDDGGVGLGLGGEVGTGGSFELFARARLTLVGGGDAGQRGGTEVDDVGGVDAQAERFQQLRIVVPPPSSRPRSCVLAPRGSTGSSPSSRS